MESDPIGLVGGLNTYMYANVSPLSFSDFYGLDTLGIGIRNPRPGAVNDGVFNPRIDPGHTVAYLRDNDGNIYETASVGPTTPVGPLNKNDFQEGRIPATARYPIQGEFEIFEWPGIKGDQLNQCKKAFSEMIKNPGNYTPTNQCTSAAIDLATSCGLDVPSGVSPIRVPSYVPFVDSYENNLPNPVGLNLQLRLKNTSKTVDGSELKRN